MKTLIQSILAACAILSFSSCTAIVEDQTPAVNSTTTTTESSTVYHPFGGTTETRTTRTD